LLSQLAPLSGAPDDRYSVFVSYSQIYFIAPQRDTFEWKMVRYRVGSRRVGGKGRGTPTQADI